MVNEKQVVLLNFEYQVYLTYVGVIWTVGVSIFIAIWSYILISLDSINVVVLVVLGIVFISFEILLIAIYIILNYRKDNIIRQLDALYS